MERININLVFMRKDARKIDEAAVSRLMDSIKEIGLINPIRVRETSRPDHPQAWEVVAGSHRLRAMRKLGFEEIPAVIVNDDDLHAELAMIDENLMRAELSPADRASQTARRKAIYLELHPGTARGGDRSKDQTANSAVCFVDATADAIGKASRTVRIDVERGEKISEQALSLVKGTENDKGVYLDKLKKVPKEKQAERVLADLENAEKRKEMEKRNKDANRVIEMTDAQRFAEWILERTDLQEIDVVIGWLQGTKARDVISAIRREAA